MNQAKPLWSFAWIIGARIDLLLIIGGVLAGFAFLGFNVALRVPVTFLWWFWSLGFDGTHIFGTATRTYFDRSACQRNRLLLFGSLAFFFSLGPALVLAGLKPLLVLIVAVWAYYHVVRQHYGFMVLYKVKNHDLAPLDNLLDRCFLGVMLVAPPFQRFFIRHPAELGIPDRYALTFLDGPVWYLVIATAAVYLARQVQRARAGATINAPKWLLLTGVVSLHWLTFAYMSWEAAVPTVTIAHNLQYHALIWFHNRNRYEAGESEARNGFIPHAVAKSLAAYVVFGLLFSALYRIPGYHLGRVSSLAFGLFCGFGLTHYFLDSRIWRVRHDPELRTVLRLA